MSKRAPSLTSLLQKARGDGTRPLAVVLAGHNGSGKSTLWKGRLADEIKIPLINPDRLTAAILPEADTDGNFAPWAKALRDKDEQWMRLAQQTVTALTAAIHAEKARYGVETAFSHLRHNEDGSIKESRYDIIKAAQDAGYFVLLVFVGLTSANMSALRVMGRVDKGGHAVPQAKIKARFPRTQEAIAHAAPLADMTLMYDNSRSTEEAFTLARAQMRDEVLFDCRDTAFTVDDGFRTLANLWLEKVAGPWPPAA